MSSRQSNKLDILLWWAAPLGEGQDTGVTVPSTTVAVDNYHVAS